MELTIVAKKIKETIVPEHCLRPTCPFHRAISACNKQSRKTLHKSTSKATCKLGISL